MNRVIVITGGGRGIGAATARLAGQQGFFVCVNFCTNRAAAEQVVEAIEADGAKAIAIHADVSIESEVERLFDTVDEVLGPLTALVNNAGILETQMRVDAMSAARVRRIFETNVIGQFLCAREAVQRMSTKHGGVGGAIVNVSSAAARLGAPGGVQRRHRCANGWPRTGSRGRRNSCQRSSPGLHRYRHLREWWGA